MHGWCCFAFEPSNSERIRARTYAYTRDVDVDHDHVTTLDRAREELRILQVRHVDTCRPAMRTLMYNIITELTIFIERYNLIHGLGSPLRALSESDAQDDSTATSYTQSIVFLAHAERAQQPQSDVC